MADLRVTYDQQTDAAYLYFSARGDAAAHFELTEPDHDRELNPDLATELEQLAASIDEASTMFLVSEAGNAILGGVAWPEDPGQRRTSRPDSVLASGERAAQRRSVERSVEPLRFADTVPGMDEPRIKVYGSATEITIAANASGLRALAERLVGLTDPELHKGYHEHLDPGLDLEDGTVCLILARDDTL